MSCTDRVIGLLDMDCFYAQVEQRERPELWGTPVIVVQHTRQGVQGGILAVSYEAREFGVKRGMMIPEAKKCCPNLNVCHVPIGEHADKADIQKYRDASAEIFEVLNEYDASVVVEKASVDEAFLDLTVYVNNLIKSPAYDVGSFEELLVEFRSSLPSTHLANGIDKNEGNREDYTYDREENLCDWLSECRTDASQLRLALAAQTLEDIRKTILEKTKFFCSAGIANNKMMAKLVCARHKPRQQTVMPAMFAKEILRTTPIGDVRGFGGKMGRQLQESLKIKMMGEILEVDEELLIGCFQAQAGWLLRVAGGFDDEPIRPRKESSSIAVSKNFPGRSAIKTFSEMRHWVEGLTKELAKRLVADQVQNKRVAENLVYCLYSQEGRPQRTLKIASYHPDVLVDMLWKAIKPLNVSKDEGVWDPQVYNISLSANRFTAGVSTQSKQITEWVVQGSANVNNQPAVAANQEPTPGTSAGSSAKNVAPCSANVAVEQPKSEEGDFIEVDGELILREVFNELPDFIRKEYEHRIALAEARVIKQKDVVRTSKTTRGKKRANVEKPNPQQNKKSPQRIDVFFKNT